MFSYGVLQNSHTTLLNLQQTDRLVQPQYTLIWIALPIAFCGCVWKWILENAIIV